MLAAPACEYGTIIDSIYEAAVVPDLWPGVLDSIAALSQTVGGLLFTLSPRPRSLGSVAPPSPRWTTSDSIKEHFCAFVRDGMAERNTRVRRKLKNDHAGFVTDFDLFTPEEIETEPVYKYMRDAGLGWCVGFAVQVPTGDVLVFDWQRRHGDGPITPETVALLDPLRPHLARAALMASRLGLERAKAGAEALAAVGLPAAVLSTRHKVLAANGLMETLMPSVVDDHVTGRLRLADRQADQLFTTALSNALSIEMEALRGSRSPVFSVPMPAKGEQSAMVVHIIPVRRAARDIFAAAANIVIVTPVRRADVPLANVIQGLFDLTAAETRVARLIAKGETVNGIAASFNTSQDTVRKQLKAVFAKTGVSRQGELISLLGNIHAQR